MLISRFLNAASIPNLLNNRPYDGLSPHIVGRWFRGGRIDGPSSLPCSTAWITTVEPPSVGFSTGWSKTPDQECDHSSAPRFVFADPSPVQKIIHACIDADVITGAEVHLIVDDFLQRTLTTRDDIRH